MAITAASTIATDRILLNPGDSMARTVSGYFVADTYPGQWVYYTVASNGWTKATSGTAACKLMRLGIAGYKRRIRQTLTNYVGTEVTIDAVWDISETEDKSAPIHVSGICTAFITDQNAAVGVMTELIISGTAGSATIRSQEDVGAGPTTGTAFKSAVIGTLAMDVADDDTICIAAIGACMGQIWGRTN